MNWVKENKFLTGYIAVMVIGVGVLGYQVYSASDANDDASNKYTAKAAEYNRLRHLAPFPSRQNLDSYDEQKKDAARVINAFEADLSKKVIPFEEMSPSAFQDKLKTAVSGVREKAKNAEIKLPEKFYLAFDKYESVPPSTEAATPLGRQLKAIEWVVNQFLSQPSSKMQAIVDLKRNDLPEEGGGRANQRGGGGPGGRGPNAGGPGGPGRGGPGGSGGGGGERRNSGLLKYHPFTITAIMKPDGLREVLKNVTATNAPQFFVLRNIRIRNSAEKGPSRAGDPNKPEKDKDIASYVVGTEWIEVTAQFDMVDFTNPGEKLTSEDSSSSPSPTSTPARR